MDALGVEELPDCTVNAIWKFYTICMKQHKQNAKICNETDHGNCTTIIHLLTITACL